MCRSHLYAPIDSKGDLAFETDSFLLFFYCMNMNVECFCYRKGCEACQQFGNVQLVTIALMRPIIKPKLDLNGQIHSPSSKGHCFVFVATNYFAKWAEVVLLKNMTHKDVIGFITE